MWNISTLHWLVQASNLGLLVDNEVDVHVGVDKVSVRAIYAQEAVLLGPTEHRPGVRDSSALVPCIGSDPANVLASLESRNSGDRGEPGPE